MINHPQMVGVQSNKGIEEVRRYNDKVKKQLSSELSSISKLVDSFELEPGQEAVPQKKKKKMKPHCIQSMSNALKNYKTERKNVEEDLVKTLTKVNLDKQILF